MDYCCNCMEPLEAYTAVCPFCGKSSLAAVPEHHLPCGTLLRDRYLVGAALGEGGFGITYIGRDTVLDIKIAVKEYYPDGYANRNNLFSCSVTTSTAEDRLKVFTKGRSSFLQEARALAKFSREPGIVNVQDFFEENNTAYIIMEYLEGGTLRSFLKQKDRIPYGELIPMMQPLMRSLQRVHDAGLIHRDISPDNIMFSDGRMKLLDFGAARAISAEGSRSLSVILKPGYAPEEQYRSRGKQGPWTDVYALSATIYKCLTGVTPDDSAERVIEDTLQPPSALGVSLPPAAEKALMRGLAVSAHNRIQSVAELATALLTAYSGQRQPVQQPVFRQPVMQPQPVSRQPVQQPQPVSRQPVQQQQPISRQPVQQRPVSQQPLQQQPISRQPVMQPQPVSQQPVIRQPVSQQPVQQPYSQRPVVRQPYPPQKKKNSSRDIIIVVVAISIVMFLITLFIIGMFSSAASGASVNASGTGTSQSQTDTEKSATEANGTTGSSSGNDYGYDYGDFNDFFDDYFDDGG